MQPGDTGELLVRGDGNCIGYWNDPEATAQLFRDGWLHSGDLASQDEDGFLWFQGRLKQIIIRGGSNISRRRWKMPCISTRPSSKPES